MVSVSPATTSTRNRRQQNKIRFRRNSGIVVTAFWRRRRTTISSRRHLTSAPGSTDECPGIHAADAAIWHTISGDRRWNQSNLVRINQIWRGLMKFSAVMKICADQKVETYCGVAAKTLHKIILVPRGNGAVRSLCGGISTPCLHLSPVATNEAHPRGTAGGTCYWDIANRDHARPTGVLA